MIIQSTKNYKQFKTVKGNRDVDMRHVNHLITLNSVHNLLWQFPAQITKDGYIWDGQHRLKVAETQGWDFFYTVSDKTLKEMGENIVALANTAQKPWRHNDYIKYYADHGNEQYIFLQDLMKTYDISSANICALYGFVSSKMLKSGAMRLYENEEEKTLFEEVVRGYASLRESVAGKIFRDRDFARAVKTMFKQVSSEDIKHEIERSRVQVIPQVTLKDYLRMFEEIFNYGRREENHVRFF